MLQCYVRLAWFRRGSGLKRNGGLIISNGRSQCTIFSLLSKHFHIVFLTGLFICHFYNRLFFWTLFRHPGILKVPTFWVFTLSFQFFPWVLSFFLSFDIFFHVFLIKLVIFHTKTSEIFQKVPTFWALGLSFEFFPWVLSFFRLEFFSVRPKKAWTKWLS